MRTRTAALALAMAATLGGCMLASSGLSSSSCAEMTSGACQEQVQRVSARHPGARSIDLVCRAQACTRAGGAGTAVVTYPDGSTRNDTFAYLGDPNPAPAPACVAIAADLCRTIADSQVEDQPPSKAIVSVSVACTSAVCRRDGGETTVTIGFADGTSSVAGYGWSGAP